MRLLVCGGAGFIGSTFVRERVREHGDQVTVLDKLTYAGRRENLQEVDSEIHFVQGAIEDPVVVADAVGDAEAIVNFAAETHVDRSIAGPEEFLVTNMQGTHVLLEAARERRLRYLQVSTDEVYGSIEQGSFTEESPLQPSSPYSATKTGADLLVSSYFHTYGLETLICRGSNNYGPHQYPEKLIPLMILNALAGDRLPVYGDGSNVRNWLFVEDFARGIGHALAHGEPGEVYNCGGPDECDNLAVVRRIIELTGAEEGLIEFVTDRPGHDRRYSLSSQKLGALGWRAQVRLRGGAGADRSSGIAITSGGGSRSARRLPRVLRASLRTGPEGLTVADLLRARARGDLLPTLPAAGRLAGGGRARQARVVRRRGVLGASPSPGSAIPAPAVLVIGLAPAAHGGNRTGRIFTGDRSGDWLFGSLYRTGFRQPADVGGARRWADAPRVLHRRRRCGARLRPIKPTACRARQLPALSRRANWSLLESVRRHRDARVVRVGRDAAGAGGAAGCAVPRPRPKFGHGATAEVGRFTLLGCFHPSQQNTFTGKLTEPMIDAVFERAKELAD